MTPGDYDKSRQEWLEVFNEVVTPINQAGWEDWLRDPFHEGTPIFSRVKRSEKKGLVVNQILPSDDAFGFRSYLGTFAANSDEGLVEHLVISSILTEANKAKSRRLIDAYLVHNVSPADVEILCDELTG